MLVFKGVLTMEVFNSKNVSSVIFSLGMPLVLLTSFWGFYHWSHYAETVESVESQITHWKGLGLRDYSFVAADACMSIGYNKMKVADGAPQLVAGQRLVTIEERFELAREAILKADKVHIEYHPMYGFPLDIEVDWDQQVMDDECSYSIAEFQPL